MVTSEQSKTVGTGHESTFADGVTHEQADSNRKEDGNGRRREGAERKREAVEGGWPGHAEVGDWERYYVNYIACSLYELQF
jgi:hypothetical protein